MEKTKLGGGVKASLTGYEWIRLKGEGGSQEKYSELPRTGN